MSTLAQMRLPQIRFRPKLGYLVFVAVWLIVTLTVIWGFSTGRSAGMSILEAISGMLAIAGSMYSALPTDKFELAIFLWLWAPLFTAPFGLFERAYQE